MWYSWNTPGRLTVSGVALIGPDPGSPCRVILRFGTGIGGDGKSNRETWRGLAILDSNRVGATGASGREGGAVSPNRSIPENIDEEGDAGISASATGMSSGSQRAPSNSSHTSEAFLKGKPWASSTSSLTAQSSAKVEVVLRLGVTRESVLSIDVVGLRRGVVVGHGSDMGRQGGRAGGKEREYARAQLYMIRPSPGFYRWRASPTPRRRAFERPERSTWRAEGRRFVTGIGQSWINSRSEILGHKVFAIRPEGWEWEK